MFVSQKEKKKKHSHFFRKYMSAVSETEVCVCDYKRKDPSNWSRHCKNCAARKRFKSLEDDNARLEDDNNRLTQEKSEMYCAMTQSSGTPESTLYHLFVNRLLAVENSLESAQVEFEEKIEAKLAFKMAKVKPSNGLDISAITIFDETPLPKVSEVKRMLSTLRTDSSAAESIPRYLIMKHFSVLENRNIRLSNIRGQTVQMVETDMEGNKKWKHRDRNEMLKQLVETGMEELENQFGAKKYSVWCSWYTKEGLDSDGYDKKPGFRDLVKRVDHMLMSEQ